MFRGLSKLRSDRATSNGSPVDTRRVSEGKSELAITAPKRIVRALYAYDAQHDDELSFSKNDFFYVNEEPSGDWYIALNPLTNSRGLVPQAYFEVIQRQDPQAVPVSQARRAHSRSNSAVSGTSVGSTAGRGQAFHKQSASNGSQNSTSSSNRRASLAIYGFVLYDFQAERNDELTVAAGESIVIVAQSTDEWFVAKPIGRLGGPGLIPVSYIEIREVGSDQPLGNVSDAIRRANLPQVDEWKRKLAEYKASSIPLGRFGTTSEQLHSANSYKHSRSVSAAFSARSGFSAKSDASNHSGHSYSHSQNLATHTRNGSYSGDTSLNRAASNVSVGGAANGTATAGPSRSHNELPESPSIEPYVISATVDRFAVNGGRYWYLVKVEMSNGKHRNLCRFYQDFYDFQIKLLECFPEEAGRTGKTRTLPFMPGPLTLVTHTVSSQRRANLDDYVRDLIRMPPHVSQSPIVLDLFSIRPGDVESNEATQVLPQPPEDEDNQQYSGDIPSLSNENANTHDANSLQNSLQQNSAHSAGTADLKEPPRQTHHQHQESHYEDAQFDLGSRAPNPYSIPYGEGKNHGGQSEYNVSQPSLKIKVFAASNVIAIRVPQEVPFSEIYDKIATRLSMPSPQLYTNAECNGEPVNNAAKFARALNGGTKIALYLGN